MTGLLLALAVVARADDPPAPLENSKQELTTLRKNEAATKASGLNGGLKEGLPQFQSNIPSAQPLELPQPKTSQSELKKKHDAQKNWLLDGMGRLDDEAKLKTKGQGQTDREKKEPEGEKANPDDADYFLKLYSEQQQKDTEAKSSREDGKKKDPLAQNDPLAPFLQGWLAGSPVRGKFFDEFLKRPASRSGGDQSVAGGVPLWTEVSVSTGLSITDPSGGRASESTKNGGAAPNPYLQTLNLQTEVRDSPSPAPAANFAMPAARPSESRASTAPVEFPQPARSVDRKPPPSPFDDMRFFPIKK